MRQCKTILYVSQGAEGSGGLYQALRVATSNNAQFSILIVYPELQEEQQKYRKIYEDGLIEKVEGSLRDAAVALGTNPDPSVEVAIEYGSTPAIRIIRHVVRNGYDLLIKEAGNLDSDRGFRSLDMKLLRKCPCQVWLLRPSMHLQSRLRVAVAIDALSPEPAGHDLAIDLLGIASHFSKIRIPA